MPEEFSSLRQALLENKIEFDAEGNLKVKKVEAEEIQIEEFQMGGQISGLGVLLKNTLEKEIFNSAVISGVKIYLTSKGSSLGKVLFYDEVDFKEGESFKVKIDAPALKEDIQFNWLIVK